MKAPRTSGSNKGVFSIYGYFIMLLAAISLCLISGPVCLVLALFLLLTYALCCERPALHRMIRIPVIIFLLLLIGCSLLLPELIISAEKPGISSNFLLIMNLISKTLLLLLAVQIVASRISVAELNGIFERLGFHHLGFVLGVALHMLPRLHRNAVTCRNAMKMRGALKGLSFTRIVSEIRWMRAVLQQMMRHADAITVTARTRGFGLTTAPKRFPAWRSIDILPLLLTLALVFSNPLFECL